MELIRKYYEIFKTDDEAAGRSSIDDLTWSDLSMDEIFNALNETQSYIGEQVLYKRLHEPDADRDWERFERQTAFLKKNPKERAKIEKYLERIGKRKESYYLPEFLKHTELWEIKNGLLYHVLQVLLVFCIAGGLLTQNDMFLAIALMVAAVNLVIYLGVKNKYEIYLYSLGSVRQMVDFGRRMFASKEVWEIWGSKEVEDAVKVLSKVARRIGNFEGRKRVSWSGEPVALLQDYLLGITLYDISVFNHIMKVLDKKQDKLLILYQFIGEMDMVNAVAIFREKDGKVCIPEIFSQEKSKGQGENSWTEAKTICMQGLHHPLLENAVPNDLKTRGRVLISGANASGKSTFMKAVAINVILAQTVHTCTAERVKIPALFVMTSMSIRDDILTGESYYIKEVKYLKRMLDDVGTGKPVLCVIDEILKGTNTKERLAASEAILKYFAEKNGLVMVATHDMELVEKMQSDYECYYFESKVEDGDIRFDYILHEGTGGKSNAVALLELAGYPMEVVERARQNLQGSVE